MYDQDTLGVYNASHAGKLLDNKTIDVQSQLETAISYNITGNNNTLMNIKTGMLGSTIITHDIYNKSYSKNTYGYFDDFDKHGRIEKEPNTIYNDQRGIGSFPNSRIYVNPTSTTTDFQDAQHSGGITSNQLSETLLHRKGRLAELTNGIRIQMKVNGNTTLTAGQKIIFDKPANSEISNRLDPYYQGEFLVTQTRHIFNQVEKKHEIIFSAAKDSIPAPEET